MAVSDYLESMDFTTLRKLILDMAPEDVDKSEGSFMYDAVTPIALFVSEMLSQMKLILEQSFIGTATGANLDMIAATMPRLYRQEAIPERLILRLSPFADAIKNYILNNQTTLMFSNSSGETFKLDVEQEDWIEDDASNVYLRVYKTVNGRGSSVVGQAFEPSPAITGLEVCQVHEVTSGGGEEETDDHFRVRIWAAMSSPFLGSVADYQRKIFSEFPTSQNGFNVANCFIMPRGSKSGYICVIPAKEGPNGEVQHCEQGELTSLQEYLDKRIDGIGGYGMGVAPIGHVVRVRDFTDFNIHIKVTVTVARGRANEINIDSVREQISSATNSYLRSIIEETVPSSTNYMANAQRYVSFFIYYYVNAHEYAILSVLRNSFGTDLIKTVLIEREQIVNHWDLDDITLSGVLDNEVPLTENNIVITNDYVGGGDISEYQLYKEGSDFDSIGELRFISDNLKFVENGTAEPQTLSGVKLQRLSLQPQTDLVIKSGDSKGTLPKLGDLNVVIVEAEG